MTPLATPLPNLLLLQLDVSRLVAGGADKEEGDEVAGVKGIETRRGQGQGRVMAVELPQEVCASLIATSLSLLHRWGLRAEAGVALKRLLQPCKILSRLPCPTFE
jgi:hypothetical protein